MFLEVLLQISLRKGNEQYTKRSPSSDQKRHSSYRCKRCAVTASLFLVLLRSTLVVRCQCETEPIRLRDCAQWKKLAWDVQLSKSHSSGSLRKKMERNGYNKYWKWAARRLALLAVVYQSSMDGQWDGVGDVEENSEAGIPVKTKVLNEAIT